MSAHAKLATVAACAGDPARANMLSVLMDGRAFTAGELATAANVTPQTASGHLSRMVHAGLLDVVSQGRHRYFRIASPQVGRMLEGMMVVAASLSPARPGPAQADLRLARSCYDHLAGRLGVALADRLCQENYLVLSDDGGAITDSGKVFFSRRGIDTALPHTGRVFCRPCLDWSERRHHLAGVLGARIMTSFLDAGWIARKRGDRAINVTPEGRKKLRDLYGIRLDG